MKRLFLLPLISTICFGTVYSADFTEVKKSIEQLCSGKLNTDLRYCKRSKYSFVVDCGGKKYVIRKFTPRDSAQKKLAEIQLMRDVSDAGFGPVFVGVPKNEEFYIVEFSGRAVTPQDFKPELLKRMGQIIRKMHDFEFAGTGLSHKMRLKKVYKSCQRTSVALPDGFAKACEEYINSPQEPLHTGFCHGNLSANHVRIDENGKITFINWKYAGRNDTSEDIGYFLLTNGIDDDQIAYFLEGYLGRTPNNVEIEAVKTARDKACLLVSAECFKRSSSRAGKKLLLEKKKEELNDPRPQSIFECQLPFAGKDKEAWRIYAVSTWEHYNKRFGKEPGWIETCWSAIKNLFR